MTTKYTLINFVFKNLMIQFSKLANVYFLIIMIMQTIKPISITDGTPVQAMPLLSVIIISMIKDAFEDYKRYVSDKDENIESKCNVYNS